MARRRAFTLVEILVALGIVALVSALAIALLSSVNARAQQKAATAQAQTLAQAVSAYYAVNGCYPDPAGAGSWAMPTGSATAPFAPYVGGQWPPGSSQMYFALDQSTSWVTSGGTAYYVGVVPSYVYASEGWSAIVTDSRAAVLVANTPVPVC